MKHLLISIFVLALCAAPLAAQQESVPPQPSAQDVAALVQQVKDLQERVIMLEGKVRTLQSTQTATASTSASEASPQATATPATGTTSEVAASTKPEPTYGGAGGSAAKALNPDISVIGDFIGAAGRTDVPALASQQAFPSLQMHESEIGLQAVIDPCARGDFFVSFGEEGVNLEEGYITFTALPKGFVAKVGKMRSVFGKVNTMHNHVLPWVDRPLVSTNLVGGEDGINDAGFSIEHIIPAPKGIFLEATGQLFRGDSGDVFQSSQRSDVSAVARLRGYKDITESTNLDLGLSYARGHNDQGTNFLTNLYGVDATLRWKPLRRSIYHSFIARSEFTWSQRQELPRQQNAFGFYTSADYQFARRWFVGGRFDQSSRARFDNLTDHGGSITLTYWPSEFSQIRGQYRVTNYAENIRANEFLVQLIFSLGAHGAHTF